MYFVKKWRTFSLSLFFFKQYQVFCSQTLLIYLRKRACAKKDKVAIISTNIFAQEKCLRADECDIALFLGYGNKIMTNLVTVAMQGKVTGIDNMH